MAYKTFKEVQRFNQVWLWIFLIVISLYLVYLAISSVYTQIYLGHSWGNKPMSDNMLWFFAVFMFVTGLGLPLFFATFQLTTKIDEHGIYYRLKPFQRKYRLIKWTEISKAYIRKYRPILEYGGWGIRYGKGGKAINVAGKLGIQLQLTNKKNLLIGTQKPTEAGEVIRHYMKEGENEIHQ